MTSVLLVDDEISLLEMGKEILETRHGLEVNTAASAREGLAIFSRSSQEAIVSDYQMPDMDGIEFLKNIRKIDGKFPFILFTGKGHEEVAINALNNGADFYLKKEGSPKVMYTELANMIERSAARYRLEVQLKETLDLLSDAEKMGMMGCWEYNFVNKRFRCSPETLEILRKPESFLARRDQEVLNLAVEEDREKVTEMLKAAKIEGRSTAGAVRIMVGPDEVHTCYLKIKPMMDSSGRVYKISGILQDLSSTYNLHENLSSWLKRK